MHVLLLMLFSLVFWITLIIFMFLIPWCAVISYPFFFNRKKAYRFFLMRFLRIWLGMLVQLPKVSGLDNIPRTGGLVMVSNHWSVIDFFLINSVSPRFINIFIDSVFFKWFMIPVPDGADLLREDNSNPSVAALFLKRAMDRINGGEAVAIFPEGVKADKEARMRPLKGGLYKIIEATDPVILPVNIKRGFEMRFPFLVLKPEITIGRPIGKDDILAKRDTFVRQKIDEL